MIYGLLFIIVVEYAMSYDVVPLEYRMIFSHKNKAKAKHFYKHELTHLVISQGPIFNTKTILSQGLPKKDGHEWDPIRCYGHDVIWFMSKYSKHSGSWMPGT